MEWPNEFNRAGYKYARFLVIEGQETSTPLRTEERLQLPSPSESLIIGDEVDNSSVATINANISFAQSDATVLERY